MLAASVAYGIGCKNLFSINVEFYTGEDTTLDAPVLLPPLPDPADLADARVLVVDDIVRRHTDRWIDFPWSSDG